MAFEDQCNKCGRSLSDCPYYSKDNTGICRYYVEPIDNSKFFSHFFTAKGRIGRVQYLVTALIAVAFYALLYFGIGKISGINEVTGSIITLIGFILAAALITLAGLKRCHDLGVDWWYAVIPVLLIFITGIAIWVIGAAALFFLFFQKSEDGPNEYGTEPLKPYLTQVESLE